jgi:hypothetical protein
VSECDGYEPGVPVSEARMQTRERLPCWVATAPARPRRRAVNDELVIASQGA